MVGNHVRKTTEWIEKLTCLGIVLEDNLCVDLILQFLPDSFSHFIINFNMSKFKVTLPELLNMLREAESVIKKEKPVLYIGETKKKRKASKTLKKGQGHRKTRSVYHICNLLQVLARPGRLVRGEMDFKMGNGARVDAVAVGEWTPHYTPQLNGVSERRNCTLLDMVRSMMSFADLHVSFWGYALETIAYLLNRVPSKSVVSIPYEIWKRKKSDLKIVKIWDCSVHVRRHNPDKLESRTEWCTFVGYPKETCGYYFYQPNDRNVFIVERALFLKKEHILGGNSGSEIKLSEVGEPSSRIIPEPESVHVPNVQVPTLHRSNRVSHPPERYVGYISGDDSHDIDPQTYEEAIMSIDSGK
ncbi:hypothetical protein OPV22_008644 [Ensete ventricosum]|uniref:Retroviral polymerase SH3-like domain-containing protein n=1 Tax=Ensete ventricosum TaxID=4639 RepID=A0AAV8RHG7_ENSVE|nr:hypothetical protein OPV22_008644 [Ensete ventricosum]